MKSGVSRESNINHLFKFFEDYSVYYNKITEIKSFCIATPILLL